jgi:hypothetical protein
MNEKIDQFRYNKVFYYSMNFQDFRWIENQFGRKFDEKSHVSISIFSLLRYSKKSEFSFFSASRTHSQQDTSKHLFPHSTCSF